eukprot:tig00021290_g19976.t1
MLPSPPESVEMQPLPPVQPPPAAAPAVAAAAGGFEDRANLSGVDGKLGRIQLLLDKSVQRAATDGTGLTPRLSSFRGSRAAAERASAAADSALSDAGESSYAFGASPQSAASFLRANVSGQPSLDPSAGPAPPVAARHGRGRPTPPRFRLPADFGGLFSSQSDAEGTGASSATDVDGMAPVPPREARSERVRRPRLRVSAPRSLRNPLAPPPPPPVPLDDDDLPSDVEYSAEPFSVGTPPSGPPAPVVYSSEAPAPPAPSAPKPLAARERDFHEGLREIREVMRHAERWQFDQSVLHHGESTAGSPPVCLDEMDKSKASPRPASPRPPPPPRPSTPPTHQLDLAPPPRLRFDTPEHASRLVIYLKAVEGDPVTATPHKALNL